MRCPPAVRACACSPCRRRCPWRRQPAALPTWARPRCRCRSGCRGRCRCRRCRRRWAAGAAGCRPCSWWWLKRCAWPACCSRRCCRPRPRRRRSAEYPLPPWPAIRCISVWYGSMGAGRPSQPQAWSATHTKISEVAGTYRGTAGRDRSTRRPPDTNPGSKLPEPGSDHLMRT